MNLLITFLGLVLMYQPAFLPKSYRLSKYSAEINTRIGQKASSDTFFVINESEEVLRVKGASAKCGCVSTEYEKRDLNKGDSAMVIVHYSPQFTGSFGENVYIKTNGDPKKYWFYIYGETEAENKE